jgi:dTMP kinase
VTWVEKLNQSVPKPDLTIVVVTSVKTARERRAIRGGKSELFEYETLQRRLVSFYQALPDVFPGNSIVTVDGEGSVEEIGDAILNALNIALSKTKHSQ